MGEYLITTNYVPKVIEIDYRNLLLRCLATRDGQSRTFGCSRIVLELNFSNLEFPTRSMKLVAFWQNDMAKMRNKFIQCDNSITKHVYDSAKKSSNQDVPFSTQF